MPCGLVQELMSNQWQFYWGHHLGVRMSCLCFLCVSTCVWLCARVYYSQRIFLVSHCVSVTLDSNSDQQNTEQKTMEPAQICSLFVTMWPSWNSLNFLQEHQQRNWPFCIVIIGCFNAYQSENYITQKQAFAEWWEWIKKTHSFLLHLT